MLRGLRTRILLWTILPLAVVLIAIAYLGVNNHQAAMRQLVAERDAVLARVAATEISQLLTDRARELAMLDPAHIEERDPQAFDGGVAVLDAQNNLIHAVPSREEWTGRLAHLAEQGAYSTPFLENNVWHVLVGHDLAQGRMVGDFSLPPLGGFSPRGIVYLVNSQGIIIAHVRPSLVGTDLSGHGGIADAARGKAGATFHLDPNGVELVVGYAPIAPAGWALIIDEPWAEIVDPMFQYAVLLPVVLLLAAIVALGAVYFGVSNVIRPLQTLSQMANRIAFGDYRAAEKPAGGVQEIEDVRENLNGMARQLQSAQAATQDYIAAITRSQEDERRRLARELHDDTIQSLIALRQRAEMVQKAMNKDVALAARRVEELKELIGETLTSVRGFVRDLRPTYLEELGLIPALETIAREANASFELTGPEQRLDAERELIMFRIVQEALRNIAKHAQASTVSVKLAFEADAVTATIQDDGIGFDAPEAPTAYARAGHFGLTGMQERAQLFGGNVYIKSEQGKGTTVLAYVPLGDTRKSPDVPSPSDGVK
ncbi:MAG: ATP-binding protein [Anaerolineae bacterium]